MKDFFKPDDCDIHHTSLVITIDKANRLLRERGTPVVGGSGDGHPISWYTETRFDFVRTHQAILINIEEIEQEDTAESLLQELLKIKHVLDMNQIESIRNRAKRLLSKTNEK